MKLLKILFAMFKFSPIKIISIWLLDLIDVLIVSITPMIIGFVIDGLLMKDFKWFYIFIIIEIIMLISGAVNRYFDTRIYSKLIERFSIDYFDREVQKGTDTSTIT